MNSIEADVAGRAAGSLEPGFLTGQQRLIRLIEMTLLFVGMPLAMSYAIHAYHVSLLLMLQPVLIGLILVLLWDRTFSLRREIARGFPLGELRWVAGALVIGAGILSVFVLQTRAADFLSMPQRNPRLWIIIMIFYPLLSALPQELVYRTFFFHRYGPLFESRQWLLIGVNGALFGFAHIMFGSIVTIVLSGALGLLLAYRYTRTRSLSAVWLEHSLYGQLVFTLGMGRYFYTGVSMIGHH